MAKNPNPKGGLTAKHLIGYGCGDLGGCMTFALMGAIVTRYYYNILKVDPYLLAILLMIWNIWDAVNDPMMGALMDKMFAKHRDPRGKFRPWLLRSAPLVCITAIAFWTVPTFFEGIPMVVALFCCKILYEGTYTMFNIPMGSLLSAMANTDEERAALSSARGFGSTIGNIIPAVVAPLIIGAFSENAMGYRIAGSVCAVIGFVFCFLHYYMTEERNIPVNSNENADNIKFTDILNVFRVNRAFLALCLHGICICTMQYVGSTLGSFMYGDVYGDIKLMSLSSVLSVPLMIIILVVSPKVAKKLGLENYIRYGLIAGCILYCGLFVAHMFVTVPVVIHTVWAALASGLGMISIQMQWGLVGEAIDYNEYLTGKRTEGSIYGTFNLARRIGQTVGNSAGVLALSAIGYNNATGAVQTASTLMGIKVLCVLVPGIFLIGSWAAFKFVWNITPEIREKMAAFKAAKSAPAAPAAPAEPAE